MGLEGVGRTIVSYLNKFCSVLFFIHTKSETEYCLKISVKESQRGKLGKKGNTGFALIRGLKIGKQRKRGMGVIVIV